jgi:hypothetical protein
MRVSSFSNFCVNDCRSFVISASTSSSSSPSASSDKSMTSSSVFCSSRKGDVNSFNTLSLCIVDCAFSLLFQKPASASCFSRFSSSLSLADRSKRVL